MLYDDFGIGPWFTLFKTMALNEVRVHHKYILDMQILK
jgi:hypothetical protein